MTSSAPLAWIRPRMALSVFAAGAALLLPHAASFAADEVPAASFVAQVDREDVADLAATQVTPADVLKGLLPEVLETPEKREERERCERIIQAGFKCMPPARSYTRYSLPGVNFSVGSAALPDGMKATLKTFAEALRGRQSQAAVIRVDGHADATGSADVNLALSQRRAESVRDYLVSLGVSPSLFVVQGFGSRALRNAQDPSGSENRRVEIARNLSSK
jgi:OmpA-OmpF porin, OOP family